MVGDRRFVLLGEASHGSHEFYRERARITQRLIEEKGFNAVAVEADWPDAYRVNRYVMGQSSDCGRCTARWPASNASRRGCGATVTSSASSNGCGPATTPTPSIRPRPASTASTSTACAPRWRPSSATSTPSTPTRPVPPGTDTAASTTSAPKAPEYGRSVALDLKLPCEKEVVAELVDLRRRADLILARDGWTAEDEFFFAEQNARLVRNAEEYYRQMYRAEVSSWNLRDRHMASTLDALVSHLDHQLGRARVVVWEHNSHVGDARATDMGAAGELNVGQLVRTRWSSDCLLVGFTTHHGRVTAASDWGGPAERKHVRPALDGSYEQLFHQRRARTSSSSPLVGEARQALHDPRLERAIGVIYRPHTERASHWFHARLAGPVRCRHPPRPHHRRRAVGTNGAVGRRRTARDLPDRPLGRRVRNRAARGGSSRPGRRPQVDADYHRGSRCRQGRGRTPRSQTTRRGSSSHAGTRRGTRGACRRLRVGGRARRGRRPGPGNDRQPARAPPAPGRGRLRHQVLRSGRPGMIHTRWPSSAYWTTSSCT